MAVRFVAAMLLAIAAPAAGQTKPEPLPAPEGATFRHAHSGLSFPTEIIGLKRKSGSEYVKPQLDIAFVYRSEDGSEELSVYAYRVTSGSASLWFDVASESIVQRASFGRKTPMGAPIAFAPPGQANSSALRQTWTLSETDWRSTALVIVPLGEWLVKLRHSSTTHEAASLQRRTEAAIAGLGWPADIPSRPDAGPVAPCTQGLALTGKSRAAPSDASTTLIAAMMAQIEGRKDKKPSEPDKPGAPISWCVDRAVKSIGSVYRPNGERDRYLMVISDSGRAVWVRPGVAGLLDTKAKPSWAVSLVRAGDVVNFPPRDRLPPPEQLADIFKQGAASRVATWGNQKIDIDAGQLK